MCWLTSKSVDKSCASRKLKSEATWMRWRYTFMCARRMTSETGYLGCGVGSWCVHTRMYDVEVTCSTAEEPIIGCRARKEDN